MPSENFASSRHTLRRVASPRATCRISNVMSFPVAFRGRNAYKRIWHRFQKGENDRRSHSNCGFDATLRPWGSTIDRVARNQIVPRFYFQEIARDVISLQLYYYVKRCFYCTKDYCIKDALNFSTNNYKFYIILMNLYSKKYFSFNFLFPSRK